MNNNYRNIEKMNSINDGTRSLLESVVSNEIVLALQDWTDNNTIDCVLIGGLALSYYVKPRTTMDVDILFLSDNDISQNVFGFKRTREHAFQHNKTHVKVEVLSPEFLKISHELAQVVFDTSIMSDNIKIASISGIIALKLSRFSRQDQADIEALINYAKETNQSIDLSIFKLSEDIQNRFSHF